MSNKKPLCFLSIVLTLLATLACTTPKSLPDDPQVRDAISGTRVFYIHGAGDDSATWAKALANGDTDLALDWKEEASNRLTAPAKGYRLGLSLATYISPGEHTVYAHSAGAWVAQGMADGLARLGRTDALKIIFLDPFTAFSVVQPFRGPGDWAGTRLRLKPGILPMIPSRLPRVGSHAGQGSTLTARYRWNPAERQPTGQ
jgi:hypothetical protein